MSRKLILINIFFTLVTALSVLLNTIIGKNSLSFTEFLNFNTKIGSYNEMIFINFQLPKIISATITGFSLGISGYLTRKIFRNKLATPDFLGVNQSAAASISIFLLVFQIGVTSIISPIIFSFFGGLISLTILIYISYSKKTINNQKLLLTGSALNIGMSSLIFYSFSKNSNQQINSISSFIIGDFVVKDWEFIRKIIVPIIICIIVLLFVRKNIKYLLLPEELQHHIGLNTQTNRLKMLLVAILFTSVSVSISGPILFLAFISVELSSYIFNYEYYSISYSILTGIIIANFALFASNNTFDGATPASLWITLLGISILLLLVLLRRKSSA